MFFVGLPLPDEVQEPEVEVYVGTRREANDIEDSDYTEDTGNINCIEGAQWLSGRVIGSRPRGRGFEPHQHHCVVVLEQDTFILA